MVSILSQVALIVAAVLTVVLALTGELSTMLRILRLVVWSVAPLPKDVHYSDVLSSPAFGKRLDRSRQFIFDLQPVRSCGFAQCKAA